MKEREERIKRDLETEQDKTVEGFQTRIKGSFHSARKRSSATEADLQASVIRIVALLFLVIMLIAYLQWGSQALYGFLIIVPLYGWLKFRK